MTNPTSNFGWQMPTSTDLVTDLPADFEVFGQAVDTSLADLKGGTTGQVLKKNTDTDMDFVWAADTAGMTNPMTTTGDTIYSSSGSTPARLGIGSTGDVLTVAGGVPTWAAPAGLPTGWTLLNAGGTALTAAQTITVSGISAKELLILIKDASDSTTNSQFTIRFNGDTAANYSSFGSLYQFTPSNPEGIQSYKYSNFSDATQIQIGKHSNSSGSSIASAIYVDKADTTGTKRFIATTGLTTNNSDAGQTVSVQGLYEASAAITSVSIISDQANFDNGTIYVMGS
jgi:hypothetical protein